MNTTNTTSTESNSDSTGLKLTLLLVSTLTVMGATIISPALPMMAAHFAATPSAEFLTQLAVTMPALFAALTAPLVGVTADRLGRKPLLVGGILLYAAAGSSGYVFSGWMLDSLGAILVGRAFLGVAIGMIYVTSTVLISDYYVGEQRDRLLGLQSAAIAFAGVVFLPVAGLLTEIGWRLPFLVYLVSLVFLPAIFVFIYEPEGTGSATSVAGIESFRRMFRRLPLGSLGPIYLVILVGEIAFYVVPTQMPFYLQSIGISGAAVGIAIAVTTLFSTITAGVLYERLHARITFSKICAVLFGCIGVGYVLASLVTTYFLILAGLAVVGIGVGLLVPNQKAWTAAVTPDDDQGVALSGMTSLMFFGQFLSPIILVPFQARFGLATTLAGLGGIVLIFALGFAGLNVGMNDPTKESEPAD